MTPVHILLVEDNEGDIILTKEALEEGKIVNYTSVVRDGEQAINFLNKSGEFYFALAPDLILLDINLPRKNGHEVLRYIKTSDKLKHIPVIMFTTSSSENDISQSYKGSANYFVTKPVDANDFMAAVSKFEDFWISLVNSPTKHINNEQC